MPVDANLERRTLLKQGAALAAGAALPALAADAPAVKPRQAQHLLIRRATVLSMDPAVGDLAEADVLIRDGSIVAIGQQLEGKGASVLDATGMILIPGLVDGHWHLWNSFLRNSAPLPHGNTFFKNQLAVSQRFTPALSALGVQLGLAEAVNAGITTVNNWAHNLRSPAFAEAELQAMADSGLRARLWYGYAQDLAANGHMDFDAIERLQAQWRGAAVHRLDLGLAIRGPERTEPPIWEQEFAFAASHGLPISTHIAVTAQAQQKKAVRQLAERGLLAPSVQLVHATHVDAEDLQSIARSGASVCLTPLSEMRVGYGLAPVMALHKANIPLSLGIDTLVLSGNASPFRVMQTTLNLATGISGDEQALAAGDVLYWATQGGANAMGLGAVTGSITVGKRADLVLISPRGLGMMPLTDPAASVVQSASAADVDTVIADGRLLKQGGRLLAVDVEGLRAQVAQGWAAVAAAGQG
ncbi:amidohydrolase family protein [Pseudomonas typographi]|nr:amidohydrolase family protein [Pseudomonas typographi]MBD1551170.1 amidohydrolase family protein [Pseudomonas typographi]